jgi:hypothetical protein
MLANKPLGVAQIVAGEAFPTTRNRTFLVFADPDGCFSFSVNEWTRISPAACPSGCRCPAPVDETYLEFTPDLIGPGQVKDYAGSSLPEPRALGPRPVVASHPVGPDVGDGVVDNYGFGASPNVPGLVILADAGPGAVLEDDATYGAVRQRPLRARNLAGFVNSVSWTLNDRMPFLPRTSVTAHVNVPRNICAPVAIVDWGAFTPPFSWNDVTWTLDGVIPPSHGTWAAFSAALAAKTTTVRIFAVSGQAPDELRDVNGDGVVDSRDARELHYNVISGERIVRFQTYPQNPPTIPFDLSGDGVNQPPPAPAGGGGIVRIPR